MTIREWVTNGQQELNTISDAPLLDIQWMLLHVLKQTDTAWLVTHADTPLSEKNEAAVNQMLEKRKKGIPLAYILGAWDFYGRSFKVTPDTLIPRPVTEDLVEKALEYIQKKYAENNSPLTVADIGTGSGCIAITLALEAPSTVIRHIYATDISQEALSVAQANAKKHRVSDRITFLRGNMLTPLQDKHIDLIVSNPPYVPTRELGNPTTVETEGLSHEPRQALDGGIDGQRYIQILKQANIPAIFEDTGGVIQTFLIE